MAGGK